MVRAPSAFHAGKLASCGSRPWQSVGCRCRRRSPLTPAGSSALRVTVEVSTACVSTAPRCPLLPLCGAGCLHAHWGRSWPLCTKPATAPRRRRQWAARRASFIVHHCAALFFPFDVQWAGLRCAPYGVCSRGIFTSAMGNTQRTAFATNAVCGDPKRATGALAGARNPGQHPAERQHAACIAVAEVVLYGSMHVSFQHFSFYLGGSRYSNGISSPSVQQALQAHCKRTHDIVALLGVSCNALSIRYCKSRRSDAPLHRLPIVITPASCNGVSP